MSTEWGVGLRTLGCPGVRAGCTEVWKINQMRCMHFWSSTFWARVSAFVGGCRVRCLRFRAVTSVRTTVRCQEAYGLTASCMYLCVCWRRVTVGWTSAAADYYWSMPTPLYHLQTDAHLLLLLDRLQGRPYWADRRQGVCYSQWQLANSHYALHKHTTALWPHAWLAGWLAAGLLACHLCLRLDVCLSL